MVLHHTFSCFSWHHNVTGVLYTYTQLQIKPINECINLKPTRTSFTQPLVTTAHLLNSPGFGKAPCKAPLPNTFLHHLTVVTFENRVSKPSKEELIRKKKTLGFHYDYKKFHTVLCPLIPPKWRAGCLTCRYRVTASLSSCLAGLRGYAQSELSVMEIIPPCLERYLSLYRCQASAWALIML